MDYTVIKSHVMEFKQFIEKKYIEYQNQQGGRKTLTEFANYLGVSQAVVSMWISGARVPNQASAELLANIYGMEVYDALGIPRPDKDLYYVKKMWEELEPEQKHIIREQVEKYATKKKK